MLADYRRICNGDEDYDENKSTSTQIRLIKKKLKELGVKLKTSDYDFKFYGHKKYKFIPMAPFYHFLLQEREGTIKEQYWGRPQEKYEYIKRCFKRNKKNRPK